MDNLNQPNQEPSNENKDEVKITKKSLYIGISAIAALVLAVGGYFIFKDNKNPQENSPKIDSVAIKKDSANIIKKDSLEYNEDEGYDSPYSLYTVISNTLTLPNGSKLNFGDEVFLDEIKSTSKDKIIYLHDPYKVPSTKQNPISVNSDVLIDAYSFGEFKNSFSLPPFSSLPSNIKKTILEEAGGYRDGKTYKVTQNAERAKATLSTGDFDGDKIKDFAIVLDDTEGQVSRLVIISVNKATQKPYISFAANYNDRLVLQSFPKGASIYMNSSDFLKSPREGILINNENGSVAIIYDPKAQKYKSYEQFPYEEPSATAEEYQE